MNSSDNNLSGKNKFRIPIWGYLVSILLLALFIRLAGIWRTEPINYHADEWNLATPIMKLANDAEAGLIYRYNWSGCGVIRTVGYSLWALKGWFGPYSYNNILIILRVLSALASTGAVLVAFLLTRKLFSLRVALLAAALVAVSNLPVLLGHYGTLNSIVSLIILTVMQLSYNLFEIEPAQDSPDLKMGRCCIVGLICGWGIASKWTILLAAIPITVAFFLSLWSQRKLGLWRRFIKINLQRVAIITGISLLSLLASLPDLQIAPQKVMSGFTYEVRHHKTGHHGAVTEDRFTWSKRLGRTFKIMARCGGMYLLYAGIAAVVFGVLKPSRGRIFLLLVLFLWLLVVFRNVVAGQRHHLMPFILMLMLIAILFDAMLGSRKRRFRITGGIVYSILIALSTLYTCITISPFWKPDARVLCSKWIKANAPKGSGVIWAPRTPHWAAPGEWIQPSLFKAYPRKAEIGREQYIIACRRTLKIFSKHPPMRKIVPREWFPKEPPSMEELLLYAEMNAGGGPNLALIKDFFTKPSFLGLDLRLFGLNPNQDTSFANQAVTLFRLNTPKKQNSRK